MTCGWLHIAVPTINNPNGLSCTTLSSYYANGGYVVKRKSKTDTAESVNKTIRTNYMKRKTKSIILIVAMTLAILLLATAVTAALTNGFKNYNPYGWLENFDRIKKDTELNGFEVCKDFELDFAKLIKGVKATEDRKMYQVRQKRIL